MRYIVLFTIALGFVACQDSQNKQFKAIKALEQSEKLGTPEGLQELAELHKNYGLSYTDSLASSYLYAAAMYYYFNEDYNLSQSLFTEFTSRGDSSVRQRNALCTLGSIAHKNKNFDSLDFWMDDVLENYKLTSQQWTNVQYMYQDKIESGSAEVTDYEKLSKSYWALGSYDKTIAALETAITQFPEADITPRLIYRAGFVSWEYLKDPVKAEAYYSKYLDQNPEGEYAEEVRTILESGMLQMTDEAILEMLKARS